MFLRAFHLVLTVAALGDEQRAAASPTETAQDVTVSIAACVDADELWVSQLVKMELGNESSTEALGNLHAVVTCQGDIEEIRLLNDSDEVLALRTIALQPLEGTPPDVRAHELALGIAELIRRREVALIEKPRAIEAPSARSESVAPTSQTRFEGRLGAVIALERSSGGQGQIGPDVAAQIPLGEYVSLLARVGGRRSQTVAVTDGTLAGTALSGNFGIGARVTPRTFPIECLLFGRLVGQGFRYTATSDGGATTRSADAVAWLADTGVIGTIGLSSHLGVIAEVAGAAVLHSVTIRDQGNAVSGIRGFGLSAALGVMGQL